MRVLVVISALVFALPASAATDLPEVLTRHLVEACSSPDIGTRDSCLGFLSGVIETYQALYAPATGDSLFCLPEGGEPLQFREIFLSWAAMRPELYDNLAVFSVIEALMDRLPCDG